MKKITMENFAQEVLMEKLPVLVDFYADWCMPCKMFAPVLEAVSDEYEGKVKFVKVNIDEATPLAQKYRVMSIPTLKLFIGDEEPRATFVGAMTAEELADWLAENGVE